MSSEIYVSGRLFAEPEIGRTTGNEPSVRLLLSVELIRKKTFGLYEIDRTVLPVSCFGEPATQAQSLHQGDRLVIQAHLFGTAFRPPDGSVRRGVQIRADELILPRHSAWPDSVMPTTHS
jgi:single-stranded DNA-binding protein